ncbi:hypothetical protein CL617_01330 [archaeon]|nr:hypothetical protein [archaeon]|tara:strand:- start:11370 stop:12365 length:996 start_codon:yes stop_codon:yes gene_type:complete
MANIPFIQIQGIRKSFGKNVVLDNIALDIPYGEIYGIIGKSGSGKTTLLNILIGFYKPNNGAIIFQSRNLLKDLMNVKQQFGFASQSGSFYGKLTVKENLQYFGKMYNVPENILEERIPRLLKLVSLTDAQDTQGRRLSSGMKKRLDIACSLIHDPKVLILDEPTEDLDIVLRRDINDLLRKINKEKNVTMIITSHLLHEMEDVCGRIAILNQSKIIKDGTVDELRDSTSKSVEVILKTEDQKYEQDVKSINAFNEVKDVKIARDKMYISSDNPLDALQDVIKLLNTRKKKILEIKINRPSLADVFEELTKDKVKKEVEYVKDSKSNIKGF